MHQLLCRPFHKGRCRRIEDIDNLEKLTGLLASLINDDQLIFVFRETLTELQQLLADIRYDPQRYFSFEIY